MRVQEPEVEDHPPFAFGARCLLRHQEYARHSQGVVHPLDRSHQQEALELSLQELQFLLVDLRQAVSVIPFRG